MKDYLTFLKSIFLFIGGKECDYATEIIQKFENQVNSDSTLRSFCTKYFKNKLFENEELIIERTYAFKTKEMAKIYISQTTDSINSMAETLNGWVNLIGEYNCINMPYNVDDYAVVLDTLYVELKGLYFNLSNFKSFFIKKKEFIYVKLKDSAQYQIYAKDIFRIIVKNINNKNSVNIINSKIKSYIRTNTIQIINAFSNYYKSEIQNRKYYFKKELKQPFNEINFIKSIFKELNDLKYDKSKTITNSTTTEHQKIIIESLKYFINELGEYYKYVIENISNFGMRNMKVDDILNSKQNIQSQFIWNKGKADFVELIQALYITNSIRREDNQALSKKEFVDFMGKVFNFPIKSFDTSLKSAEERKRENNRFLKELNTKYLEEIEKKEEKNRSRK